MYRMLIVDDEEIITDSLYEVFQNLKHLDLDVYKAYSGDEALELLEKTRVDVILSDIRMPEIDGLQLLQHVRGIWPKCRVIFLTGYNEFDYVYTAIQHEGVSYLLKTEGYEKVIQTVETVISEIEQNLKAEEIILKAKEQLGTTVELLRKDYFSAIIKGELSAGELDQQQLNELDVSFNIDSEVLMLLGRIDDMPGKISYSDKTKLLFNIKLIGEQYFSTNASCVHFSDGNAGLVWLFQPNKEIVCSEEAADTLWSKLIIFIKGNVEIIQEACKKSLGVTLSFALDDNPVAWGGVAERYSRLKMLLNYRIGQGTGLLLTDKSLIVKDSWLPEGNIPEKLHRKQFILETLGSYLDNGRKDDFHKLFDEMINDLSDIKGIHLSYVQEYYYSIALLFLSYINKWNLAEKIALNTGLHKLMNINEHETWPNAVEYLREVADAIFSIQDTDQEKRAQDAIKKVQKHINDNINNPDMLTLVTLADLVYFNPSYLSRLFKQITNTNLSDYIWETRIKKAKQLLEEKNIKIHEVAQAIGFSSPTNFARFFKKFTNVTPQEYRDSILNR